MNYEDFLGENNTEAYLNIEKFLGKGNKEPYYELGDCYVNFLLSSWNLGRCSRKPDLFSKKPDLFSKKPDLFSKINVPDFNFEESLEVFSDMSALSLLIIDQLHIPNALNHVPNSLRHLSWSYYSLKCLPSSFQPKDLVELDLCDSKLKYLWEGAKVIWFF